MFPERQHQNGLLFAWKFVHRVLQNTAVHKDVYDFCNC